jgi:hypothetical protein
VRGRIDPARRRARVRVGGLAATLRGDLGLLLEGGTADRDPTARRVRGTVVRLEETLAFGLRFDFAPDAELALMRAHARNVVFVIRRSVEAAFRPGVELALRSDHLRHAIDLVDDLVQTVGQIGRRAHEIEADLPDEPWSGTWAGRLLRLAAALLPPDGRRAFLEDQCANLAEAESHREWIGYLVGVLAHMPAIAAATLAAAGRER